MTDGLVEVCALSAASVAAYAEARIRWERRRSERRERQREKET